MQGASVKQTRSVCSERARTPAGGRSRCGFAKQIRGFSAQSRGSKRMRCLSNFSPPCPTSSDPPPHRGESNSMQGAGVRKTRKRFWPAGEDAGRRPKPARVREANTRILRAKPQPNIDAMSIKLRLPMPRFNASPKPRRIELCSKTHAPSIPKLGRRKPKRNRRRSI